MGLQSTGIDFSGEDWNVAHEFFPGAWVIANKHGAGLNPGFTLNNRTFVFKLDNKDGQTSLVVVGCADAPVVDVVKKLAADMGLPVSFIVGNGGGHHMFLELWYEAFPEARVLVPGTRVPLTRNGIELAEKFKDRWELLHGPRADALIEEFGDALDIAFFDQLFTYSDQNAAEKVGASKNHTSERRKVSGFSLLMNMMKIGSDHTCPNDELFFFHKPSGLVLAGHNFQFIYTPKGHKPDPKHRTDMGGFPMSWMLAWMMPKGAFVSAIEGNAQPIGDYAQHAATWEKVLGWDLKAWTSFHDPVGVSGPDMSGDEIKQQVRESIARTGEDDPTGARYKWAKKFPKT